MPLALSADSIGSVALEHAQVSSDWRLVSTFRRSLLLMSERGSAIFLTARTLPRGPLSLSLSDHYDMRKWKIPTGSTFTVTNEKISCVSFEVGLDGVLIWKTPSFPHITNTFLVDRNLDLAKTLIHQFGRHQGLGGIATHLDGLFDARGHIAEGLSRLCVTAWPAMRALCLGTVARDMVQAAEGVRNLAGLGIGLTPSGDDFICGLLAGYRSSREHLEHRDPFLEELAHCTRENVRGRTTRLVENLVYCSTKGEYSEPVYNVIRAIITGDPSLLRPSLFQLIGVGETSGTDTAVGLLAGINAGIRPIHMDLS